MQVTKKKAQTANLASNAAGIVLVFKGKEGRNTSILREANDGIRSKLRAYENGCRNVMKIISVDKKLFTKSNTTTRY